MGKYIGFKLIEAEPMTAEGASAILTRPIDIRNAEQILLKGTGDVGGYVHPGYLVTYPDGYVSWSPKAQFEKAYMQVGDNNTITQDNVDRFIAGYTDTKLGEKTTVVRATLINGFEIVEASSCVDPANFNQEVGIDICVRRIKDQVWKMLGFLLQTAKNSI